MSKRHHTGKVSKTEIRCRQMTKTILDRIDGPIGRAYLNTDRVGMPFWEHNFKAYPEAIKRVKEILKKRQDEKDLINTCGGILRDI